MLTLDYEFVKIICAYDSAGAWRISVPDACSGRLSSVPTQTSMPMQTSVPTQTFRFAVIANASPAFQYVASTVLGGGQRSAAQYIYIYIYIYIRGESAPET